MLTSNKKEKANTIVNMVTEYEINELLDNDLMQQDIKSDAIKKILKIETAYMADMISMEQAIKLIAGKTE